MSPACGGRRPRPGGRHCEQRLGKGPARPPDPATLQDAHQRWHQTPRSLHAAAGPGPGPGSVPGAAAVRRRPAGRIRRCRTCGRGSV